MPGRMRKNAGGRTGFSWSCYRFIVSSRACGGHGSLCPGFARSIKRRHGAVHVVHAVGVQLDSRESADTPTRIAAALALPSLVDRVSANGTAGGVATLARDPAGSAHRSGRRGRARGPGPRHHAFLAGVGHREHAGVSPPRGDTAPASRVGRGGTRTRRNDGASGMRWWPRTTGSPGSSTAYRCAGRFVASRRGDSRFAVVKPRRPDASGWHSRHASGTIPAKII